MRSDRRRQTTPSPAGRLLACLCLFGAASAAQAGTYTTVHAFTGGADGARPFGRLTADAAGNLYGTAGAGGQDCGTFESLGCGVVFRISPTGNFTTLHAFAGGDAGSAPEYGVAFANGRIVGSALGSTNGDGLLFSMAPDGSDYTVTHIFTGLDGAYPLEVLADGHGSYFGTTLVGGIGVQKGKYGFGVLYVMGPNGDYRIAHQFTGGKDGFEPDYLVRNAAGNIFGSVAGGNSACNCGAVFEYNTHDRTFSIIYNFTNGADGEYGVLGGVDSNGVLYGAAEGVSIRHGLLFSLTPTGAGYSFKTLAPPPSSMRAAQPAAAPTVSAVGTLIGPTSTYIYGYQAGKEARLATFGPSVPVGDIGGRFVVSPSAVIYGTSVTGGITPCTYPSGATDSGGCGTVFSYAPRPAPAH